MPEISRRTSAKALWRGGGSLRSVTRPILAAGCPFTSSRALLGYPSPPMAKRRTSGIQRRSRASEEAMGRRLGAGTSRGLDWRVLVIGGILVLGVVILVLVLLFGGGTNTSTAIG
jgi:hypothetical protein